MDIPDEDTITNDEHASALLEEMNEELTSKLLPVTIFVGIEAVIGFIGNTLVVFLFAFHYKPCNYRTFSICLSLIDLTCTFTTMAGEMVTQRFWYNYPVKEICKTKDFFNIFTVSAETFCLLVISIDRFRKICQPLKWQIGPKAAVVLCFVVVFIAGAIAAPIIEFWGVRTYAKVYKNTTILITTCEKDERYEDTKYPFGYVAIVGGIIFVFLVAMFILNVAVAKRLIYERRRGLVSKQRPAKNTTTIADQTAVSVSTITIEVPLEQSKTTEEVLDEDGVTTESGVYVGEQHGVARTNDNVNREDVEKNVTKSVTDTPENANGLGLERKLTQSEINAQRIRRKALIMFILTSTFICTTIMYFTMVSILGSAGNIVNGLSTVGKTLFFFFLRFYFIQHIINPILYVLLDPQIKKGTLVLLSKLMCRMK